MDPQGKVALVTGGSSGIGRATAIALAEAGASVVIADVDDDGGRETVRMIEQAGGQAAFVHTDVTRQEDLQRMVAFAEETFGGLDIVHNNAGVGTGRPRYPEAPLEAWQRTLMIDLWAVIAGTAAAVPALRRRGGGVIVSTASVAGLIGYVPDPVYAAAKHGVVGLTRSLAPLKDEANIRVNCVCPGVVDTPMVTRGLEELEGEERAQLEAMLSAMPLIPPQAVADAVLALVRDDSLTGEAMTVIYGRPSRLIPPPFEFRRDPAQER
ncbi:MAG: SDR family oxidoreductase [Chloroflexi bacterium]|nr:SDR family oxidoreductase [Chloroflexota bacterium]